jgi:hypothetical protein
MGWAYWAIFIKGVIKPKYLVWGLFKAFYWAGLIKGLIKPKHFIWGPVQIIS